MSTADLSWMQTAADHVTEREPDGTWEDCVFAAGLEFVRAGKNDRSVPKTRAEKEALRAAAGLPEEHHGATLAQLSEAIQKRFGPLVAMRITRNWPEIAAHISTGGIAVLTGNMGAFSLGHRLRRWQPGFAGAHAIFLNGKVWCDPLAPEGTYHGEQVALAEAESFFRAYDGAGALLADVGELTRETMAVYVRLNKTGKFTVPAGSTVNARSLTDAGLVKAKAFGPQATPATFHFKAVLTRTVTDPVDPRLTEMLLGSDGFFDGFYVSTAVVTEVYDPTPPPPPDTTPYDEAALNVAVTTAVTTNEAKWRVWLDAAPKED